MTSNPSSATAFQPSSSPDPELESLPEPRRPWRRATLFSLGLAGVCALALMVTLRSEVSYALMGGQPIKLGQLTAFSPQAKHANRWVQGRGVLSSTAAGYRRPLDPDRFRLAPVAGNEKVWVELREPLNGPAVPFLAPSSFVGRLVPLSDSGLSYSGLISALEDSGQPTPAPDAWLLADGASPRSYRWLLGVLAVLLAIAAFCTIGLYRLARPFRNV